MITSHYENAYQTIFSLSNLKQLKEMQNRISEPFNAYEALDSLNW